jgi:glyoxylase-like metal-dependent hydrolase (beta-lactamase superfamily II)
MIRIHPIRTGMVKVKRAQQERRKGGLLRTLTDGDWTEWLPIHAWLIEHPEGPILVDTGETARAAGKGYFPSWHPYFRRAVRTRVKPEDEIGPRLRDLGVEPDDIVTVILTHLHTDHAGGVRYFPKSRFIASRAEIRRAQGFLGQLRGYLPQHWPSWFHPRPSPMDQVRKIGPFSPCSPVTSDGTVTILPTEGHTPGHISVLVSTSDARYLLAGDTSYTQDLLIEGVPDGVSPSPTQARRTLSRILALASVRPLVYLPSHDPRAEDRLRDVEPIPRATAAGALLTNFAATVSS